MKSGKLTLDLSDNQQLLKLLKMHAAKRGKSQKAVVIEALLSYFASSQENLLLLSAADKAFAEWSNPDDEVYDTL